MAGYQFFHRYKGFFSIPIVRRAFTALLRLQGFYSTSIAGGTLQLNYSYNRFLSLPIARKAFICRFLWKRFFRSFVARGISQLPEQFFMEKSFFRVFYGQLSFCQLKKALTACL